MSPTKAPKPTDLLRASEAARRLDMTTKDLLRLIHERKIRYVMVDGIAHVPMDAVDEYRSRTAS
jgi:excisionase family DNA binding protein